MSNTTWNRRRFLGTTLSSAVGSTLAGTAIAPALFGASAAQAQAKSVTVGLIYVGPRDDYGWNQAHAVAAKALKSVPGVKVVEEENVPETVAVRKTMEGMIQSDGASLVFGTSFGYFDPFMVDMAKKYPKVEFRHPTSLWSADKHPMNLGGYFCYLDQAHYVNGIAAGLSTKTNKIGYVAAKPIAIVLRNINTFTMGVRKVNPNAVVQLVFTGDWSMPVREAEATNALIAAGNDVIACHVDSPKVVIETAEKAGVKTLGHNASQAQLAPKGFITGAENKWETVYKSFAADVGAGQEAAQPVLRRLRQGHGAEHALRRRRQRAGAQCGHRSHRRPEGRQADLRRPGQEQHRQGGARQGATATTTRCSRRWTTWSKAWPARWADPARRVRADTQSSSCRAVPAPRSGAARGCRRSRSRPSRASGACAGAAPRKRARDVRRGKPQSYLIV